MTRPFIPLYKILRFGQQCKDKQKPEGHPCNHTNENFPQRERAGGGEFQSKKIHECGNIYDQDQIELIHAPFVPILVNQLDSGIKKDFKAKVKFLTYRQSYKAENSRYNSTNLLDQGSVEVELPVWRIGPLGVELIIEEKNSKYRNLLSPGAIIDLTIFPMNSKQSFGGVVISTITPIQNFDVIGIRWYLPTSDDKEFAVSTIPIDQNKTKELKLPELHIEKRSFKRWQCPSDFLPLGRTENPLGLNDEVFFHIRDISTNGMQLSTDLKNNFFIPGMIFESDIVFPMIGNSTVKFKVQNVRIGNLNLAEQFILGVEIISKDDHLKYLIGQFLAQFGDNVSLPEIYKQGLQIKSVSSLLKFSFVRTQDDYEEVLNLRRVTFNYWLKKENRSEIEFVGNIFDIRGRLLLAHHREKLVATTRIHFHLFSEELEHEKYITLPKELPSHDKIIEISKLCLHPDYHDVFVFSSILKYILLMAIESNRDYILTSSIPFITKMYKQFGAKQLGVKFIHSDFGDLSHELILINVKSIILGRGLNPILWTLHLKGFYLHLLKKGLISPTIFAKLRLKIFNFISKVHFFLKKP